MNANLGKSIDFLKKQGKILFLTTSNRWNGQDDVPKSTLLARKIRSLLPGQEVEILDISKLNIVVCEGNISTKDGNQCGLKKALLVDEEKNPSRLHRCWASLNNPEDELWKVSKALFESDCVVFFASVRWGQLNSIYQKLIERLTWIENRHSTLGEKNVVGHIKAGVIVVSQNWRGDKNLKIQKNVLGYFGFEVRDELSWNWQFTENINEESAEAYLEAAADFRKTFEV